MTQCGIMENEKETKEKRDLLTETFASQFRVDESLDFEGIFFVENAIKGGIFHFTTASFEEETLRGTIIHGLVEPGTS